jgi:SSS family solute:Na+ symporter
MTTNLSLADGMVLLAYFSGLTVLGVWCARRTRTSEHFMSAGRAMPGWALALTLFGSFVSSISFLAQPGKSYAGNWNPFVFCFALPVAAVIGARVFVPFYRRKGEVSAYTHLERRFGPWARTYATICFIMLQLTRTGVVAYLLALALAPAFGLVPGQDTRGLIGLIVALGVVLTVFPLLGGTDAAIWTGAAQSIVLTAGMVVSLLTVLWKIPGGWTQLTQTAAEHHKFGLGSVDFDFTQATVLVVFLYALTENLRNFGVNQTYVQLYATARTERDARTCVWTGALLYIPLAAMTYLVGTALFSFYATQPGLLPEGMPADRVFPHFIYTQLPSGLKGLVIAAVCAAATDSNFNCIATLFHCDIYKRYWRPGASETESLRVLRAATLACGAITVVIASAMLEVKQVLDVWWTLAGIIAGGMLGLFLLGLGTRRVDGRAAAIGVVGGTVAIIWMTLSTESCAQVIRSVFPGFDWPASWEWLRFRVHEFMIPVVGTLVVVLLGLLAGRRAPSCATGAAGDPARDTTN